MIEKSIGWENDNNRKWMLNPFSNDIYIGTVKQNLTDRLDSNTGPVTKCSNNLKTI